MNHLLSILLTAILCATASAQTIRTLGYNTTNYSIVYTGESALVWTSSLGVIFSNEIVFRDAQGNTAAVSGTGIAFGSTNTNPTAIVFGFEDAGGEVLRSIARTNLSLGLSALTNTSNATMMRALSGSTNTNHPYSGSISVTGTNNTNTLVFSNGILQSVQ